MKYFTKMLFFTYLFLQTARAHSLPYAVDGDSLVDEETQIRLVGIDAPEIFQTCYQNNEEYACGQEAFAYLKNLIKDNTINCTCLEQKDNYGRLLCECFTKDLSLNQQMVKAGWAVVYRSDKYSAEQNEAMQNKVGLWQGKFMRPALFRTLERLQQQENRP